jgi:hypothetical protein
MTESAMSDALRTVLAEMELMVDKPGRKSWSYIVVDGAAVEVGWLDYRGWSEPIIWAEEGATIDEARELIAFAERLQAALISETEAT